MEDTKVCEGSDAAIMLKFCKVFKSKNFELLLESEC